MEKSKNIFKIIGSFILMALAVVTGGAVMAATVTVEGDDSRVGRSAGSSLEGGGAVRENQSSVSNNEAMADPEYYTKAIDERLVKIEPYSTPIDTIARMGARKISVKSWEVKVYRLGTRPIKTALKTAVEKQTSGTQVVITPTDANMFDDCDTIRVVGVKGYKEDGTTVSDKDLILYVIGKDTSTGNPAVVAVNGLKDSNDGTTWLPAIAANTTLIRMGKACAESDAQTGKFSIVPTSGSQYCQNFMCQIQQSTIEKIVDKEVKDWNFNALEEHGIWDMKRGMELTYLFGEKRKFNHPIKLEQVHTMNGIYYQAAKDLVIGHYDSTAKAAVVDFKDMVDFCQSAFTGIGSGSRNKILIAGSGVISALDKMEVDKIRIIDTEKKWGLEFKSFKSFNGTVNALHDELFDEIDPNMGYLIDPGELVKATLIPFGRNVLELKKAGILNADAVVLQEVSCVYLRNPYACARVQLATE